MNTIQQQTANALLRISLGILITAHGLLKLLVFTLPGTVGYFESLGLPGILAYAVTFGEIIGGAMLVLGLYVRPVVAALIPVLIGATWVHAGNGWVFNSPNGGWEFPLFLVITSVVLFLSGPGRWSLQKA